MLAGPRLRDGCRVNNGGEGPVLGKYCGDIRGVSQVALDGDGAAGGRGGTGEVRVNYLQAGLPWSPRCRPPAGWFVLDDLQALTP